MSNFIISCGGTGGHLAPGIAIGNELIARGHNVIFVISKKKIDSKLTEKYPHLKFVKISSSPFSLNPIKAFKFIVNQTKGFLDSIKLIKKNDIDVAVAFGGFNSLPVALASKLLKKSLVLHEANMKVGKAVRFLGKIADKIYIPYGTYIIRTRKRTVRHAGYPVRKEIKKIDKNLAKKNFGFEEYENVLLIFGGSQGALVLNKFLDYNLEKFKEDGISVLCICGQNYDNINDIEYLAKDARIRNIKKIPFCEDMASALSCCDLVIARAGAGSIAEFARCKLPSILVPLPTSADNHQKENALRIERLGACLMLEQKNINKLYEETKFLFFNEELKEIMQKNLTRIDELNDVSAMIKEIELIAKARQQK